MGLQGDSEHSQVRDPAAGDAEAEGQARNEGGQEDDVRQGGEGGGEEGEECGQGVPGQGPQGLDLRRLRETAPFSSAGGSSSVQCRMSAAVISTQRGPATGEWSSSSIDQAVSEFSELHCNY